VVNPTAAEFGLAAVVPTDEARGEAKVELKSQLKSQFAAGLGAGAVASAQVLTQHALMAMHAWPARVSQGVTEVPAIASVDGSGGSQNRQGGSDMESVCPPPTHPSAHEGQPAGAAANSAATSAVTSTARSITFLLVSEGSRAPPCIRRLANATSLDYVLAELRTAMNLPTAAPLVYLAPEFDEWVAIDDLSALPEKCRVRAMVLGAMAAVELADEAPSAFTAECTAEVPPAGGRSTQTRQTKARQTARLGAARSSEPEQPEAPPPPPKSIE
jgi:hypothetical protein